jgi:hypothetical protein
MKNILKSTQTKLRQGIVYAYRIRYLASSEKLLIKGCTITSVPKIRGELELVSERRKYLIPVYKTSMDLKLGEMPTIEMLRKLSEYLISYYPLNKHCIFIEETTNKIKGKTEITRYKLKEDSYETLK